MILLNVKSIDKLRGLAAGIDIIPPYDQTDTSILSFPLNILILLNIPFALMPSKCHSQ